MRAGQHVSFSSFHMSHHHPHSASPSVPRFELVRVSSIQQYLAPRRLHNHGLQLWRGWSFAQAPQSRCQFQQPRHLPSPGPAGLKAGCCSPRDGKETNASGRSRLTHRHHTSLRNGPISQAQRLPCRQLSCCGHRAGVSTSCHAVGSSGFAAPMQQEQKMKSGTSQLAKGAASQSRSRDALLHDFKRPI